VRQRTSLRVHARRTKPTAIALVLILVTSAYGMALAQTAAAAQGQQPPVHHNFTEVATGKGLPTKGALQASVQSYKSDHGSVVQVREWYKSSHEARAGLDRLIKSASRVIKQGTKKDAKGRLIGKRVELAFSRGHKASPEMVIAWTDGATVVRLSSTSLPLLRDFESQYYP
jgi:hypothetical protein